MPSSFKLMNDRYDVITYLESAYERDEDKVPAEIRGVRSTREVADNLGWPLSKARRVLQALCGRDAIRGWDSEPGIGLSWAARIPAPAHTGPRVPVTLPSAY